MALVQLGRKDEADHTLGSALANDPENALTHANQGWAFLHRGDHERALEHFREALRIDPELDWARIGIVEALKARYLIYRFMLRFFLWMSRKGTAARWVILLGFVFGRRDPGEYRPRQSRSGADHCPDPGPELRFSPADLDLEPAVQPALALQ